MFPRLSTPPAPTNGSHPNCSPEDPQPPAARPKDTSQTQFLTLPSRSGASSWPPAFTLPFTYSHLPIFCISDVQTWCSCCPWGNCPFLPSDSKQSAGSTPVVGRPATQSPHTPPSRCSPSGPLAPALSTPRPGTPTAHAAGTVHTSRPWGCFPGPPVPSCRSPPCRPLSTAAWLPLPPGWPCASPHAPLFLFAHGE